MARKVSWDAISKVTLYSMELRRIASAARCCTTASGVAVLEPKPSERPLVGWNFS